MARSPGFKPVQVWSDKNLLPSWSGSLSREAASGPTSRSLYNHPETRPRLEPEEEVPAHERGCHHSPTVHPWKEDNPVRVIIIWCTVSSVECIMVLTCTVYLLILFVHLQ